MTCRSRDPWQSTPDRQAQTWAPTICTGFIIDVGVRRREPGLEMATLGSAECGGTRRKTCREAAATMKSRMANLRRCPPLLSINGSRPSKGIGKEKPWSLAWPSRINELLLLSDVDLLRKPPPFILIPSPRRFAPNCSRFVPGGLVAHNGTIWPPRGLLK